MKRATPPVPKSRPETTSIRWTAEDWKLVEALRKHSGVRQVSEIVRMGLRALARERKIK